MNRKVEERLPQIVEERLQEAYESIRKGEIKQVGKRRSSYRKWMGVAAALVLVVSVPSAVYAAVSYFQKNTQQQADSLIYEFELNYELIPGEYQVTPGYLPEGISDQGAGKYYGEGDDWITVMPIYTMAELEKANKEIVVDNIDKVEHTVLSGMEADVILFKEAEKYRRDTCLFLFNEREGYVLNIIAGYTMSKEEVLQFADSLSVVRIGDGGYATEQDKTERIKEEEAARRAGQEGENQEEALRQTGVPSDKIFGVGEELYTYGGALGYKVTDYQFLKSLEGFAREDFFDYARFDGWLHEDKTLRPYKRQHYSKDGKLLSEEETAQEILRVDVEISCYDDQWEGLPLGEAELGLELVYMDRTKDGAYTWAQDYYEAVPSEEYSLQMDNSAVYVNVASHTEGEDRKDFFFRDMKKGETISYTLLFVVDKDRKEDFLLGVIGTNSSIWQGESMTVEEMQSELEGYIRL